MMTIKASNNDQLILVDDSDYANLMRWKWWAHLSSNSYYARGGRSGSMHRYLMGCVKGDGKTVDHIDGNGLNNQRGNLRFCTISSNIQRGRTKCKNKHGFIGVTKMLTKNYVNRPYRAKILHNNKEIRLGYFATPEQAAMAYDAAAIKIHGNHARVNFKKG